MGNKVLGNILKPKSDNKMMKISAKQPLIQQMPYKERTKKSINKSNIKKFYT